MIMVLIEREDARVQRPKISHPKAATRIFQLLGHVMVMPTVEAQIKASHAGLDHVPAETLPAQSEMDAYHAQVILPAFEDALIIAKAAGSEATMKELGERDRFMADVQNCILGDDHHPKDLHTVGAKEWAQLKPLNDRLLGMLALLNKD